MSGSFVTPWAVAHQGPLSMGFTRLEYWSGLPFLSPGDLTEQGFEPMTPIGLYYVQIISHEIMRMDYVLNLSSGFFVFGQRLQ